MMSDVHLHCMIRMGMGSVGLHWVDRGDELGCIGPVGVDDLRRMTKIP